MGGEDLTFHSAKRVSTCPSCVCLFCQSPIKLRDGRVAKQNRPFFWWSRTWCHTAYISGTGRRGKRKNRMLHNMLSSADSASTAALYRTRSFSFAAIRSPRKPKTFYRQHVSFVPVRYLCKTDGYKRPETKRYSLCCHWGQRKINKSIYTINPWPEKLQIHFHLIHQQIHLKSIVSALNVYLVLTDTAFIHTLSMILHFLLKDELKLNFHKLSLWDQKRGYGVRKSALKHFLDIFQDCYLNNTLKAVFFLAKECFFHSDITTSTSGNFL